LAWWNFAADLLQLYSVYIYQSKWSLIRLWSQSLKPHLINKSL